MLKLIVVRAHAGEPPFVFRYLEIFVYELRTDADLTSRFCLFNLHRALIPDVPGHGIESDFDAPAEFDLRNILILNVRIGDSTLGFWRVGATKNIGRDL
jgi:hypothetical protein